MIFLSLAGSVEFYCSFCILYSTFFHTNNEMKKLIHVFNPIQSDPIQPIPDAKERVLKHPTKKPIAMLEFKSIVKTVECEMS